MRTRRGRRLDFSAGNISGGFVLWLSFVGLLAGPALAQQGFEAELRRAAARPADPEAAFELARAAAEAGDLQTAIAALERLLLLYPDLANIKLELGILYLQTGATELGESLLREALASPEMPPEVRGRAEEFLAAAEAANDPLTIRGTVGAGLVADSNANSAPEASDLGFGFTPAATGESDASAFGQAAIEVRYDLGFQAGHAAALDAFVFTQRYGEQSELDLDRIALSAGVDFNLSYLAGRPAELSARLGGNLAWRDGDDYLSELGPTLAFRIAPDERTGVELAAFWREQDYRPTDRVPANDERDGEIAGVSLRGDFRLAPRQSVYVGASALSKAAEQDYEAYDQIALSAGYAVVFEAPGGVGAVPWIASLNGTVSRTDYDGPDPFFVDRLGQTGAREDETWTVAAGLRIPLRDRLAMDLEVGHTEQDSTYSTNEYDNTFGSVGVSWRF